MTEEKTKKLFKRFKFFQPDRSITQGLMAFGFECGDGWFDLIWELCEGIEKELDKHPEMRDGVKFTWYERVVNFFHSLFFYFKIELKRIRNKSYKKHPNLERSIFNKNKIKFYEYKVYPFEVVQVKEKFGTLRFYTNFETKEIGDLIREAEEKSAITCEICGKPGRTMTTGYWLKTVCPKHAKEEGFMTFKEFEKKAKEIEG